jgi:hypothetical protein
MQLIISNRKIILLLMLFIALNATAQRLTDTLNIDYSQYKGKLIVINECHNVAANNIVYEHIIKKIVAVCKANDTINLLLETPYS